MTTPGSAEDRLLDALVQSAYATMAVLNRAAADHDLSLTQLRVIGILRDRRLRMSALADYLGLERSTMSGLVDRAVQRGLLERSPSAEDRRAIEVGISPAGLELADRVLAEIRAGLAPAAGELPPTDQLQLASLLERTLPTAGA